MTYAGSRYTVNNEAVKKAEGQTIADLTLNRTVLTINFTSEYAIDIVDTMQQCCEQRYITTDDNLESFIGAMFLGVECLDAVDIPIADENLYHQVQFVHVHTSMGVFVLETHNIHNGYYGGFDVEIEEV